MDGSDARKHEPGSDRRIVHECTARVGRRPPDDVGPFGEPRSDRVHRFLRSLYGHPSSAGEVNDRTGRAVKRHGASRVDCSLDRRLGIGGSSSADGRIAARGQHHLGVREIDVYRIRLRDEPDERGERRCRPCDGIAVVGREHDCIAGVAQRRQRCSHAAINACRHRRDEDDENRGRAAPCERHCWGDIAWIDGDERGTCVSRHSLCADHHAAGLDAVGGRATDSPGACQRNRAVQRCDDRP